MPILLEGGRFVFDAGVGLELDWRLMARHYSENARPGLRSSDPLGTENTSTQLLLLLSRADLNYEKFSEPVCNLQASGLAWRKLSRI